MDRNSENVLEIKSESATCNKCGGFKVQPENVWFDERGTGYSTRLTKCTHCGRVVILGYKEDYGFSKMNYDRRLYYKNK